MLACNYSWNDRLMDKIMINAFKILLHLLTRLLTFAEAVVGKILLNPSSEGAHKNPECLSKVASGFLMSSRHINLVSVAGQSIAPLQSNRLLDQISVRMDRENSFWGSFSFSFLLPVFFPLSLKLNLFNPLTLKA